MLFVKFHEDAVDGSKQVWFCAHCYSKDKKYSFGNVLFEFDARNIVNREMIESIRKAGDMKNEEKLAVYTQKIDELQEENEKRVRKISELREQAQIEYDKGVQAERKNNLDLIEDHDRLEKDLQAANARILQLEQENQIARAQRSALNTLRSMAEMPLNNEDVVRYFMNVFGDRLAFTDRGIKTACHCDIKPDGLWYYLYQMATTLFDIYHACTAEPEKSLYHAAGIEMAPGEKGRTNQNDRVMKTRNDIYQGKEIYAAPHVKLSDQRSGGNKRRIYFCYDRGLDRIIISWVGDHLETAVSYH